MDRLLENGNIETVTPGYDPERGLYYHGPRVQIPPSDSEYEKAMLWLSPEDRVKARRFLLKHRNTVKQESSPAK